MSTNSATGLNNSAPYTVTTDIKHQTNIEHQPTVTYHSKSTCAALETATFLSNDKSYRKETSFTSINNRSTSPNFDVAIEVQEDTAPPTQQQTKDSNLRASTPQETVKSTNENPNTSGFTEVTIDNNTSEPNDATEGLQNIENGLQSLKKVIFAPDATAGNEINEQLRTNIDSLLNELATIKQEESDAQTKLYKFAKFSGYSLLAVFAVVNLYGLGSILTATGQANFGAIAFRSIAAIAPACLYLGNLGATSEKLKAGASKAMDFLKNCCQHANNHNQTEAQTSISTLVSRLKNAPEVMKTSFFATLGLVYAGGSTILDASNAKAGTFEIFKLWGAGDTVANALSYFMAAGNGLVEGLGTLASVVQVFRLYADPMKKLVRGSYHSENELKEIASMLENLHNLEVGQEGCMRDFLGSMTSAERTKYTEICSDLKKNKNDLIKELNKYLNNEALDKDCYGRLMAAIELVSMGLISIYVGWQFGSAFSAGQKLNHYKNSLTAYPLGKNVMETLSYFLQGSAFSNYPIEILKKIYQTLKKMLTTGIEWPKTGQEWGTKGIQILFLIAPISYAIVAQGGADALREVINKEHELGLSSSTILSDWVPPMGYVFDITLIASLLSLLGKATYDTVKPLAESIATKVSLCMGCSKQPSSEELDRMEAGLPSKGNSDHNPLLNKSNTGSQCSFISNKMYYEKG
ncbi:hypothetical protein [uncultured Endozoicomonas sp.]|uniref:hypothetical protein n=1 Tax=uncultured Endozoicomonas sp. TaxID=432652 RepID=UPI002629BD7C|nr:hypothetical protein [uncultured Endozoicomonas sp.]